ncbi:MAG TPA: hypothetical protein DDY68_05525 [Porphyromonadaceae bacterium]|nr:hypothetical protein [Porphyromonadaceae bacterium]
MKVKSIYRIFEEATESYHLTDDVNASPKNPYKEGSVEELYWKKNWIDAVQWHLEDIIRNPELEAQEGMKIKHRIDKSNQDRTDIVESIDDVFIETFKDIVPKENARINTETPAWALDRLSILVLKIYHMQKEVSRKDASKEHISFCENKLNVLRTQRKDLIQSIEELLEDIASGNKRMKVYRQVKMYNDPSLNPILYKKEK